MLTFVVVVQLSEISPPKYRSSAITVFYICWALGALYTTTAGYFVLNANGWIVSRFCDVYTVYIVSTMTILTAVSLITKLAMKLMEF